MITFSRIGDHGRLGNQLFQYALLIGVEARTGLEAAFPAASTKNPHLLDHFNIDPKRFAAALPRPAHTYREKRYDFDPCVFKVKDGTDFVGYFQTERYFEHVADTLRRELMPASRYMHQARERIRTVRASFPDGERQPLTVIHMRRGDNVHGGGMDPAEHAKAIPCQPLSYYRNAIAHLEQHVGSGLYIVLSNTPEDAAWCREHFPLERAAYFGGPEGNPLVDFATMILADHLVISNSTMSWWAGWLRDGSPKLLLYPTLWFGPKLSGPRYQLHDLWPKRPNWIQIESFKEEA